MSSMALKSFYTMNLVPNMGKKGGLFKKTENTNADNEMSMSKTQMTFGPTTDDTKNKFGQTATNMSLLNRELNNNTVPLRVEHSRHTAR